MVRVLGWVMAVALAVLTVTGVWLVFEYRPGPPDAMRRAHQVASVVTVNAALVLLLTRLWQRRLRPALVAVGVFLAVSAASFTGYLLPWDQLALWAVTVGTDIDGVLTAASNDIRFVLLGGAEVSTTTYRRWLLVHTVGIPLATAAIFGGRKFLLRW